MACYITDPALFSLALGILMLTGMEVWMIESLLQDMFSSGVVRL